MDVIMTAPRLAAEAVAVLEGSGYDLASHGGKAIVDTLETYPRDELFQAPVAELARAIIALLALTALGVPGLAALFLAGVGIGISPAVRLATAMLAVGRGIADAVGWRRDALVGRCRLWLLVVVHDNSFG